MLLKVRFSGFPPSLLPRPAAETAVEAEPGITLAGVMRSLDVPEGSGMAFVVNGRVRPPEYQPEDGDDIAAVRSLAGG